MKRCGSRRSLENLIYTRKSKIFPHNFRSVLENWKTYVKFTKAERFREDTLKYAFLKQAVNEVRAREDQETRAKAFYNKKLQKRLLEILKIGSEKCME